MSDHRKIDFYDADGRHMRLTMAFEHGARVVGVIVKDEATAVCALNAGSVEAAIRRLQMMRKEMGP